VEDTPNLIIQLDTSSLALAPGIKGVAGMVHAAHWRQRWSTERR